MIKAPKVIVTTQEKLVVGTRTLGAPLHEHEVGRTMSGGHRFCAERSGAEKGPHEKAKHPVDVLRARFDAPSAAVPR